MDGNNSPGFLARLFGKKQAPKAEAKKEESFVDLKAYLVFVQGL